MVACHASRHPRATIILLTGRAGRRASLEARYYRTFQKVSGELIQSISSTTHLVYEYHLLYQKVEVPWLERGCDSHGEGSHRHQAPAHSVVA